MEKIGHLDIDWVAFNERIDAVEGVVKQPPLCTSNPRHPSTVHCTDVDQVSRDIGMQLRAARLPHDAYLSDRSFPRDYRAAVSRAA